MKTWKIETTDVYDRKHRRFEKKNPDELRSMLNNLDTYYKSLTSLGHPQKIVASYIHKEPKGVKAIDQKGSKAKLKQTRLYIYPNIETKTLYLMTIGDKKTQRKDIKFCENFVKTLRREKNG
ncbi:MAG: hypothetical protein ACUZ8E_00520 [Candidatus Anammoxibacter sp.]